MTAHLLDNPIWSSLTTKHASFAVIQGSAGRYPPQVAPFAGVSAADPGVLSQLEVLINGGESVYFVGVAPEFGAGWRVDSAFPIPQLVCATPAVVRSGPEAVPLTEAHRTDMLALTALVFPGSSVRAPLRWGDISASTTGACSRRWPASACAWMGIRKSVPSAHIPEFIGRGYAQRLVALLVNAVLERGDTPFLHTHRENTRALALYDHLGFKIRTEVMLWTPDRAALRRAHARRRAAKQPGFALWM